MTAQRVKIALTGLQWTLGLIILIEAILFLLPNAAHAFASTHLPNLIRMVLGWGEIAGCILMLIPRTAVRGAWVLAAVFLLAIVIHLSCTACTKSEIWPSIPPRPGPSP